MNVPQREVIKAGSSKIIEAARAVIGVCVRHSLHVAVQQPDVKSGTIWTRKASCEVVCDVSGSVTDALHAGNGLSGSLDADDFDTA